MRLDVQNTRSTDGDFRWKTVDEFFQTYWSGLDAAIYANDVQMDEILSLQWKLDEAVAPLFSYASYVYDTVMHGARRVQGAFTINFKREGYLYELLSQLAQPKGSPRAPNFQRSEAFRLAAAGDATLEHFVAMAGAAGTTRKDTNHRVSVPPELLKQVADDFEKAIWGERPASTPGSSVQGLVGSEQFYTSPRRARFELANRFDLAVHFGSFSGPKPPQGTLVGSEGVTNEQPRAIPVGTSQKLVGIALTSRELLVDDSGRPVLESYTFIARDVI